MSCPRSPRSIAVSMWRAYGQGDPRRSECPLTEILAEFVVRQKLCQATRPWTQLDSPVTETASAGVDWFRSKSAVQRNRGAVLNWLINASGDLMPEAIVLRQTGEPSVLLPESVEVGAAGAGELRIRHTAIGVNFHDIYVRSGLYRTLALPGIPGIEASGVVEEVGAGVSNFSVGDHIAYVTGRYGAYATERILPADVAVRIPPGIDDRLAATVFLKGLTAEMLMHRVHKIKAGDSILVHAAAGGVGRLLCQWASHLGATVIGTVGSEAKAKLARAAGCGHVILYRDEDFVERIRDVTGGRGVDVVYDSVGKDTFPGSLDSLATFGHLVNFGQSSGTVAPFEVALLSRGSNALSRPIVFHYLADRDRLEDMARALFGALAEGVLSAEAGDAYPLRDAAGAHEELESRRATGPLLLVP